MSSIICNRNGVIEISLGSIKPARRRRPQGKYPQLRCRVRSDALRRSRSVQQILSVIACAEPSKSMPKAVRIWKEKRVRDGCPYRAVLNQIGWQPHIGVEI